jgi:sulfatase maturation enzyme AslB (radical SAM superfamily)
MIVFVFVLLPVLALAIPVIVIVLVLVTPDAIVSATAIVIAIVSVILIAPLMNVMTTVLIQGAVMIVQKVDVNKKEVIMSNCQCKSSGDCFSPWVFTTYSCNCGCPYCIVPQKETDTISMSTETFEKMLMITEELFEKGSYDRASFRLSGGEPLLVWKNYADLVEKYKKKYREKMSFGLLSNLTVLTDSMIEWMLTHVTRKRHFPPC